MRPQLYSQEVDTASPRRRGLPLEGESTRGRAGARWVDKGTHQAGPQPLGRRGRGRSWPGWCTRPSPGARRTPCWTSPALHTDMLLCSKTSSTNIICEKLIKGTYIFTKKRIVDELVFPLVTYGCESWALRNKKEK
ncbi:hypothetical protein LAZ67_7001328 [Cordylochernes scorpioides]|uniref:Uncharacterized protein n=1 Tax=Cordylochernes scorpioides TaxID=51811 RepID=A0ABY6KS76_9ARAC|nr:hypothetical protein LAZ67_7001328 [Cordylochernes scorpioides]